jgi:hypothetical protein
VSLAALFVAEGVVLALLRGPSAALIGMLGPASVAAGMMGQRVTVSAAGIERRGIGVIPWDDIERIEVRDRLGGLVRSSRFRLRTGQRSNVSGAGGPTTGSVPPSRASVPGSLRPAARHKR